MLMKDIQAEMLILLPVSVEIAMFPVFSVRLPLRASLKIHSLFAAMVF